MKLIVHNNTIIDVCFDYETNITYENETNLLKVYTTENNEYYFIGTQERNEYTFVDNVTLPEDYYNLNNNEYYIYNNGFVKITE